MTFLWQQIVWAIHLTEVRLHSRKPWKSCNQLSFCWTKLRLFKTFVVYLGRGDPKAVHTSTPDWLSLICNVWGVTTTSGISLLFKFEGILNIEKISIKYCNQRKEWITDRIQESKSHSNVRFYWVYHQNMWCYQKVGPKYHWVWKSASESIWRNSCRKEDCSPIPTLCPKTIKII